MADSETYSPQYVDVDDIPVTGPDDYTKSEKQRALYKAEHRAEMDLAGGNPLSSEQDIDITHSAITELGTYYLVRGATSPSDVTLGDMSDEGDQDRQYAQDFREEYERIVASIADGTFDEGQGSYIGSSTGGGSSFAVNTKDN